MDYTTTALLASIRRRASIPTTSTTGSATADLLAYANEELQLSLMADILKVREGYFLRSYDYTISSTTTAYRIPSRAVGGKLRSIELLDSSGAVLMTLSEIAIERISDFSLLNSLAGYYIQGNNVVLVPNASTSAVTLRMRYYIRPNELVSTGTLVITSINTSTNTAVVASSVGYTTSTAVDFIAATPGFEHLDIDRTPSSTAGTTDIVFAAALPTQLAVGDYIALAGKSPVPQIPEVFHPILAQRVAVAWLEATKDTEGLENARKKLMAMESDAGLLISPRNDAGSKKIYSRFSVLGNSRRTGPR